MKEIPSVETVEFNPNSKFHPTMPKSCFFNMVRALNIKWMNKRNVISLNQNSEHCFDIKEC